MKNRTRPTKQLILPKSVYKPRTGEVWIVEIYNLIKDKYGQYIDFLFDPEYSTEIDALKSVISSEIINHKARMAVYEERLQKLQTEKIDPSSF